MIIDGQKRTQAYWLLHISGWTAFLLFKLFISIVLEEANLRQITGNYLGALFLLVTITHFYKKKILSKWVSLPIRKLPVRLLFGAFSVMAVMFLVTMVFSVVIYLILTFAHIENKNIGLNNLDRRWKTGVFILSLFTNYIAIFLWSVLYMAFRYFENLQQAKVQRAEEQGQLKDMQLKQLIRQLNPHFLFNAINSIKALTVIDAEKARDALSKMSDILRHTLSSEKSVRIPLEKELMIVEDYLSLEKIRFGKRLHYSITCTPEAAKWPVPPVIIQTLAENAVKHGISSLEQGGEVIVEASTDNGHAVVRVQNTGSLDTGQLFSGIGTSNTLGRLKLLYGEKASFSARNEDKKVIVTLLIPRQ